MTALPMTALTDEDRSGTGSEPCVLLKLGEIVLKGKNRQHFGRLLQNNIRLAIAGLGLGVRLWQRDGVIVLTPEALSASMSPEQAADQIAGRMPDVRGVARVCGAERIAKDAAVAIEAATRLAEGRTGS